MFTVEPPPEPRPVGGGVDFGDAAEGGLHGLVYDRVAAGFDDLRAFDRALAVDVDFDGADKRFVLLEDGCGLVPLVEKTVVDEFVIPTKLAGGDATSGFRGGV